MCLLFVIITLQIVHRKLLISKISINYTLSLYISYTVYMFVFSIILHITYRSQLSNVSNCKYVLLAQLTIPGKQ